MSTMSSRTGAEISPARFYRMIVYSSYVESTMLGSPEVLKWLKNTRARKLHLPFLVTNRLDAMKTIANNRSITILDLGEYSVS
jgi:hypothetical protein